MEKYHNNSTLTKLKSFFFQNKKNPFDSEHIHIAVHVRRPSKFDDRIDGSNVPIGYFVECMMKVVEIFKNANKPYLFHIYSLGKPEDFSEFSKFPCKYHFEDDTFTSFIGMAYAHILIMSPSSYSYTAGLLSNGIVMYKPFWHPPLKHWFVLPQYI